MAKTKTSAYGLEEQKIVPVRKYKRNGKWVAGHRRSTPDPYTPRKKKDGKKK